MKSFNRLWNDPANPPPLPADLRVEGLALDSRKVNPGDLFLGLKGQHDNGASYLADAQAAGAVAALVDGDFPVPNDGFPVALVPDLRGRVSALAAELLDHPGKDMNVIGITGTNGKTSSAWLTAALLNRLGDKACVCGTVGYGMLSNLHATSLTTPDAIEIQDILASMKALECNHLCMEVSSHGLEQNRVEAVPFDCAVFTNFGHDHLDHHKSLNNYWQAKQRLFSWPTLSAAVLNADDDKTPLLMEACSGLNQLSFGFREEADVRMSALMPFATGFEALLSAGGSKVTVRCNMMGQHSLANLLSAVSVALLFGNRLDDIAEAIDGLPAVPGRMQPIAGEVDDPLVLVDYAHNPDGLKAALEAVRTHVGGRILCVFGCGGDRDRAKRAPMGSIASALADVVYLTNDNPRNENPKSILDDIQQGCHSDVPVYIIADRAEAICAAVQEAGSEDVVLFAGRGHEDMQIIGGEQIAMHDPDLATAALMLRSH